MKKGLGVGIKPFPPEIENNLVEYIQKMEGMFYGLTTQDVRSIAFLLAEKNKLPHYFSNEKKSGEKIWLKSFLGRNQQSNRIPKLISTARARSFNKKNVYSCFNLLESLSRKTGNFPKN